MKLVIVESPSKAKTINKYLGSDYTVSSSVGHIRDLPKSNTNAIDIPGGFIPHYEISLGKKKVVDELVHYARKADAIILATDPDREGEAIAWHLAELLKENLGESILTKTKRVTFNAITKETVLDAMSHPRDIDQNLRKAQEARRVLDRLVGYDLSGLIWKKVRYGLSAGRVQSPALRIIMEREREIRAFIPDDYFILSGIFSPTTDHSQRCVLTCDVEPQTREEATRIETQARKGSWRVVAIKESRQERKARAPFITSTLQQVASTRLGFSPSRTMGTAQKLYESGHITYMRTDSPSLSPDAQTSILKFIEKKFGKNYVHRTNYASTSKNAQEAHEAIRPTVIDDVTNRGLTSDQQALYELIWQRTISSQMAPADIMKTKLSASIATTDAKDFPYFSTHGSRILFPGWLLADPLSRGEDVEVPQFAQNDPLTLHELTNEQKWTQPPNRYSEAGLIKELEKRGIGRPSTYASIIKTLQDREYVLKEGRTLIPTDTGDVVSSFLEQHFTRYISDDFTAQMENNLDDIARGEADYAKTLGAFYTPFHNEVLGKNDIAKITNLGDADKQFVCPTCGSSMVIKLGRGGKFLSCSNYPECQGALTLTGKALAGDGEPLGIDPQTKLPVYVKEGRFGAYVQLGESPEKESKQVQPKTKKLKEKKLPQASNASAVIKPKRASLPRHLTPESITLAEALHLLILPRTLGIHPESGEPLVANVGRFGPYIGHGREFRSLKKGDDPYTISFDRALQILAEPKALPKGVTLIKDFGNIGKSTKPLRILESRSGKFIQKGMKRIYLPDTINIETITPEELLALSQVA